MEDPPLISQDPFGLNVQPPLSMKFVQPDRRKLVVLGRIADDPEPDYCVHGRTRCYECDAWCHLGSETIKVVESGEAMPMCTHCATGLIKPDGLIRHVDDRGNSHR